MGYLYQQVCSIFQFESFNTAGKIALKFALTQSKAGGFSTTGPLLTLIKI
jgi:hypothetical protein